MILPLTKTGKSQIALTLASPLRCSRKLLCCRGVQRRRITQAIRSSTVHKVTIVREAPALVDVRRVADVGQSSRDVWCQKQKPRFGLAYHLHTEVRRRLAMPQETPAVAHLIRSIPNHY